MRLDLEATAPAECEIKRRAPAAARSAWPQNEKKARPPANRPGRATLIFATSNDSGIIHRDLDARGLQFPNAN
jgi:hypothetical protein